MGLLDLVINNQGRIVVDLDTLLVKFHLVHQNTCLHIKLSSDSCTSAEMNKVSFDKWVRRPPLNIDAVRLTRYNGVLTYLDLILRFGLDHDASRLEALQQAILNRDICIDSNDSSCM